jgi:hypothetical protein
VKDKIGIVDTYELSSLLIQPIQRIPRYALLLQDLISNTASDHPDLNNLIIAMEQIQTTASFIDSQKRTFENSQKILDIQNKIGEKYELFKLHRRVILEGRVSIIKSTKIVEAECWLLNDILLIWAETERSLINRREGKVHLYEDILNISIRDNANVGDNVQRRDDSFTVIGTKKERELVPHSKKINKEVWINSISLQIQETKDNRQHSPLKHRPSMLIPDVLQTSKSLPLVLDEVTITPNQEKAEPMTRKITLRQRLGSSPRYENGKKEDKNEVEEEVKHKPNAVRKTLTLNNFFSDSNSETPKAKQQVLGSHDGTEKIQPQTLSYKKKRRKSISSGKFILGRQKLTESNGLPITPSQISLPGVEDSEYPLVTRTNSSFTTSIYNTPSPTFTTNRRSAKRYTDKKRKKRSPRNHKSKRETNLYKQG